MEKLSRVKKYAELRKSIETDNNIDKTLHTEENGALEQEETLKKFDSSIFKKVDIKEDGEYTPVREKKEEPLEQPPVDDTFTNEEATPPVTKIYFVSPTAITVLIICF